MITPDKVHPQYQFEASVKNTEYQLILKAMGNKPIRSAITLPGLSNYAFERQLISLYPDIEIHCFEKDKVIWSKISANFDKPEGVKLHNKTVEEWLTDSPYVYDMIFLDYCTGPEAYIDDLIKPSLAKDGIFAVTLYHGRGVTKSIYPKGLSLASEPLHYKHMYFLMFRNSPQRNKILSCKLTEKCHRTFKPEPKQPQWSLLINKLCKDHQPTEEYISKVYDAIQKLPEKQKETLVMKFEHNYTYGDIGRKEHITEIGAFFRVSSAIKTLSKVSAV